jgi:protein-disulfide isomerase
MNEKKAKEGDAKVSKRQMVREQRARKDRQQRLLVIGGIIVVALLLAGLLIIPSIQSANAPVGDINTITPRDLPNPNGTALGDPNARVKIEVWEDFQCPACRTYSEQIETLIIDNLVKPGLVYYVYRHYPFLDSQSITKESQQAANASMCAADQGRFWDYHDIIFANWNSENQGAFADKRLVAFAESIGLDMEKFNTCFENNQFREQIQADFNAGQSAGVNGTPSVFVNGVIVNPGYVPSYDEIKQQVDAVLSGS